MQYLLGLLLLNPLWGLVILGLQLGVIVHALKSGKGQNWIYLLIFLPGLGAVAYFVVEIFLPWWRIKQMISQAAAKPKQVVKVNLDELEQEYTFNPTFANLTAMAGGYAQMGDLKKAEELYEKSLAGIYAQDEVVLGNLARLVMEMGKDEKALEVWRQLEKLSGGNLKPDELLALAKCLDKLGKTEDAEKYFMMAAGRYPGLEANYLYCQFLEKKGEKTKLAEQLGEVKRKYESYAPRYRKEEREWWDKINKAFRE